MTNQEITIEDKIINQLDLIKKINELIAISKRMNSELMVRQHEHLKKEYTKNLFEMLKKNYQISIPKLKEAA